MTLCLPGHPIPSDSFHGLCHADCREPWRLVGVRDGFKILLGRFRTSVAARLRMRSVWQE